MKKKKIYATVLSAGLAVCFVSACSKDRVMPEEDVLQTANNKLTVQPAESYGIPGEMYLKVNEEAISQMRVSQQTNELDMQSVPTQMSLTLQTLGTKRLERVFPYAGKYEARTKKEGLDRWFKVSFDKGQNVTEAIAMMKKLPEVSACEPIYATKVDGTPDPYTPAPMATDDEINKIKKDLPFNDPDLILQWHYKNFGLYPGSVKGADADIFDAWKMTTGKPNVIVDIVDGFLDATHEDLKDNVWTNKGEIPDNGIDDDHNGYIDDVHGYNFVTNKGELSPDDVSHGTHVAGTVAAKNNNGIGVAGVAGGDGSPDSGVRLMSSQIFRHENEQGNSPAAIKYGADNGAVISQNSWGYTYPGPGFIPGPVKDAIDYFIKYAGCDENGNQLADSPMKGGVVIFAAGNDDKDYLSYPSAYKRVISVSAMAPNWKKAYYTNRGDWVTIMAPGGDANFSKGMVYSTLSPLVPSTGGKKYGYMQGTSMACPHVSGIAALIVSYYGGKGFTNEKLKQILSNALNPTQNVDLNNPNFKGRLGAGYIDAMVAFDKPNKNAPEKVTSLSAVAGYTDLMLSWQSIVDENKRPMSFYNIYYATVPISDANLNASAIKKEKIYGTGLKAGTVMNHKLLNLETGTKYYLAIEAVDKWGKHSPLYAIERSTKVNNPPVIGALPEMPIPVSTIKKQDFDIEVSEPDGQDWSFAIEGDSKGVTVQKTSTGLHVTIRAVAELGVHAFKLVVTDILGLSTTQEIRFEVFKYKNPVVSQTMPYRIIGINEGQTEIDLSKYFTYDQFIQPNFAAKSGNSMAVSTKIEGNKLLLNPFKPGESVISVTLDDGISDIVFTKFDVRVVEDTSAPVYSVYPIPTTKKLNILLNPNMKTAEISIQSTRGETVYKKVHNIGFNGLVILNVSKFSVGSYKLKVKGELGTYEKAFLKL